MRRLRVVRAAVYLLAAKLALSLVGLTRLRTFAQRRRTRHAVNPDAALRIAEELRSAVRRMPLRTNCLDRAVALWFLLARAKLGATLRIGIRTGGGTNRTDKTDRTNGTNGSAAGVVGAFAAHAWVEHAGTVLLDEEAPGFTPFDAPVLASE
ncbi:MAG TPA: lasso peptide biosynthesis B2 protein [Thermoanaerobaculia bacterium]